MYYKKLKERKEELQLTTEQLADATHIPTGVINRLLRGEMNSPSPEILRALEQILFSEQPHFSDADQTSDCHTASIMRESVPAYQFSPSTSIGPYTIEDYLALPDDVRAELIDGNIIYMEAPTVTHQDFLFEAAVALHSYIKENSRSCKVFVAPLDVQLDCDDKTIVQPDIIVVCSHDKITEKRIYGAPDLCIEIISPSTRSHDMITKLRKYKTAGVREYWMVDTRRKQIICYFFESEISPVIYPFETPVPVHIFDGKLTIDFSELEAGLNK